MGGGVLGLRGGVGMRWVMMVASRGGEGSTIVHLSSVLLWVVRVLIVVGRW